MSFLRLWNNKVGGWWWYLTHVTLHLGGARHVVVVVLIERHIWAVTLMTRPMDPYFEIR